MIDEVQHKLVEVSGSVDKFIESGFHWSWHIKLADRMKSFECRAHEFDMLLERVFGWHSVDRDDIERSGTHEIRMSCRK